MNKHTPGTWSHWSGYNHVDKIEAQVTAKDGDIVIASYNNLISEGEANARLICAAPDLLDALEDIVQWVERGDYEDSFLAAARAAIARARGEA